MNHEDLLLVAVACAWLACGLAAVCLTPTNRAARALLAAGVLLGLARLTEFVVLEGSLSSGEFAVLRTVAEWTFLGMLVAVVETLVRLPDGHADRRWQARLPVALAVVAVLTPVAQLLGSARLEHGSDPATARDNPYAVGWLSGLGEIGQALAATEPAWLLLGVGVLVRRYAGKDPVARRPLRWPLASLALLTVLLAAVLVVEATGLPAPPEAVWTPVFLLALCLFPAALLVGITERAREMARHLTESRTRLVEAEDNARAALERDLHDGVQQQLVAILSLTELAVHQTHRDPQQASRTMAEVGVLAGESITGLRELVRGIRPPVLRDAGLAAALSSRLARLPADITIEPGGSGVRWAPAAEAAAYFVAAEAVTNAIKHAPGSRVSVRIGDDPGCLRLEVVDDGPGVGGEVNGTGLIGLRDRVESLGGVFEVGSAEGRGTRVVAEIPGRAS